MRILYYFALSSYIALIILTLLWEGWLAPAAHFPLGFWLALKSIPLLVPLFGLLHGKAYTYGWSSMLILFYFVEGTVLTVSHRQGPFALHSVLPYALLEILLCTIFFFSAVFYVRHTRRPR